MTPQYIFDDRFIDIMPPQKVAKPVTVYEAFKSMADGMIEKRNRQELPTAAKLVGAIIGLWLWPAKVRWPSYEVHSWLRFTFTTGRTSRSI